MLTNQFLSDLNGVERSALPKVIARYKQRKPMFDRRIRSYPANENGIFAGRIQRIWSFRNDNAGRFVEKLQCGISGNPAFELGVYR